MAGKYTPLENYLRDLPETQREVTMSFEQIERILNDKLPPSAHNRSVWWSNERIGPHVQARAWMDSGWRVNTINLTEKWIRFTRK